MGSLFSAPTPPPPPPPVALPAPDPEAQARQERLKALMRRRRGVAGLIETGPRGLGGKTPSGDAASAGKRRLGE
jgi:hypothetical protein